MVTMVIELTVVHTCMCTHALKTMNLYAQFQLNMILQTLDLQILFIFLASNQVSSYCPSDNCS